MRRICLQFLLLFAVLCAGLHAPAMAHDFHGEQGEGILELSDSHLGHGADEAPQDKSTDGSRDLFHHHHCPMAIAFGSTGVSDLDRPSRDLLRPGEAAALASLTPSPPIEPPLA